jgi:glycosyltransferase involved in cell wall biosynthesis
MPCIAVDLTPMLPGGEGGGAGVLAIDLIRRMRHVLPRYRWLLLTSSWNHAHLGSVFGGDVDRVQVIPDTVGIPFFHVPPGIQHVVRSGPLWFRRAVARAAAFANRVGSELLARRRRLVRNSPSLRERGVDLLFAPFTAPTYAEPGLPTVSILYDLQHLEYPQFFDPQEVAARNAYLAWLRRRSDVVICISEHARQMLLSRTAYPPERTRVVPIAIHDRLRSVSLEEVSAVRARLGLDREYVFYPANGWPHKNHRLLLAAFGLLRARNPHLDVDLVFTGAMLETGDDLAILARRLGLASRTHWLGYCPSDTLAAVYQGCRMVVFPSLYEGFGIPLLEAMWFGKPVACSNSTSLPEIGADAVRYFDPRRPEDIATAMRDVLVDKALAAELVAKGHERVKAFGGEGMAAAYVQAFEDVLGGRSAPTDSAAGVFPDGWTGGMVQLAHASGRKRTVEIELDAPVWLPHPAVEVRVVGASHQPARQWSVLSGERWILFITLTCI